MNPKLLMTLLMLWALSGNLQGAEYPWPDQIEDQGTTLVLAGQGQARYLLWSVYDAALYLPADVKPAQALDDQTPRCLVLRYLRDLAAGDIRKAADTVLERQQDAVTLARLKPAIDTLHRAYVDVKAGDRYRLCYAPEGSVRLYLNDQLQTEISAPGLARTYFGIWLNDRSPISKPLRRSLLALGE